VAEVGAAGGDEVAQRVALVAAAPGERHLDPLAVVERPEDDAGVGAERVDDPLADEADAEPGADPLQQRVEAVEAGDEVRRAPAAVAGPHPEVARRPVGRRVVEDRRGEVLLDADRRSGGERMVGRHRDPERLAPQQLPLEPGRVEGARRDADVDVVAAGAAAGVDQVGEQHVGGDVGAALGEQLQHRLHRLVVERRAEADHQPLRLAGGGARGGAGGVGGRQQRDGVLVEDAAGRRQLDSARRALDERRADALLELPHLRAERLLGQMQPLRRAREVQLLRDGDEGAQVTQLEAHARSLGGGAMARHRSAPAPPCDTLGAPYGCCGSVCPPLSGTSQTQPTAPPGS